MSDSELQTGTQRTYLDSVNGIAEAISYPDAGEEVTLRGDGGTAVVERVDRRRNFPVILNKNHPFRTVRKRTIVEYSQRVEEES